MLISFVLSFSPKELDPGVRIKFAPFLPSGLFFVRTSPSLGNSFLTVDVNDVYIEIKSAVSRLKPSPNRSMFRCPLNGDLPVAMQYCFLRQYGLSTCILSDIIDIGIALIFNKFVNYDFMHRYDEVNICY